MQDLKPRAARSRRARVRRHRISHLCAPLARALAGRLWGCFRVRSSGGADWARWRGRESASGGRPPLAGRGQATCGVANRDANRDQHRRVGQVAVPPMSGRGKIGSVGSCISDLGNVQCWCHVDNEVNGIAVCGAILLLRRTPRARSNGAIRDRPPRLKRAIELRQAIQLPSASTRPARLRQ